MSDYNELFNYKVQNSLIENNNRRLQLHYFESGIGNVKFQERLYPLVAPCLVCASEQDKISFVENKARIHSLYFHPKIINSDFDFEVIRKQETDLEGLQSLDIYWLLPFVKSKGLILNDPVTGSQIVKNLQLIEKELSEKKGMYWPCRSRSLFYELLNLIVNIYHSSNSVRLEKHNFEEDVAKVVEYINTNYQQKITITQLTENFAINSTMLN